MIIKGTVQVRCRVCKREQDQELVQSVNPRTHPAVKDKLMKGELNVLTCVHCGQRTPLEANVLYHDPDAAFMCHVAPNDPQKAEDAFVSSGVTGTLRIVPSLNALVEKVKIVDAQLLDWAIELNKIFLLSSLPEPDMDRVLLFDHVQGDLLHWVLFDGAQPEPTASSRAAYDKLASRQDLAPQGEHMVDRAWAVTCAQKLVHSLN